MTLKILRPRAEDCICYALFNALTGGSAEHDFCVIPVNAGGSMLLVRDWQQNMTPIIAALKPQAMYMQHVIYTSKSVDCVRKKLAEIFGPLVVVKESA